ncbi:MAG: hypothetical protein JRE88_07750 [Deltaproteobacteria bacterium]|jgi:hypothetical protein|nr:hypothetical protein [Deltaproteobacteria bacterium]MBW2516660.1 hypothetical protein [Deltaproteobacteria bacterium]
MAQKAFEPVGMMGPQIFGLPVDRDTLFSNHQEIYKKRVEKRQRKLIVKLSFLKPFLKKGEKILLTTTGYSPINSLPQYVTGFFFVYLKRSLFVFTNYRIFHVPTTPIYKFKQSISQILYVDCQSIALKGGTLTVQYAQNGMSEKFKAIALSERRKIKALLKRMPLSGTQSQLGRRSYICPRCTALLESGNYTCNACQLKFKNKTAAFILAVLFPGGGYFYTRHYFIGLISAIIEIFLMGYFYLIWQDVINKPENRMIYLVGLFAIFVIVKIISVIHSSHFTEEFIPTKKRIQTDPSAARSRPKKQKEKSKNSK